MCLRHCTCTLAIQTEFMSNPNIIRRMLEYISGEAFDPMQDEVTWPQSPSEEQSTLEHKIKCVL